jgi:hypothetical protein
MVHIDPDFPSKKAFLEALKTNREISVYQPGPFPISGNGTGVFVIEAPAHYHKWYQAVLCENCRVIKTLTESEQKKEYAKNRR